MKWQKYGKLQWKRKKFGSERAREKKIEMRERTWSDTENQRIESYS